MAEISFSSYLIKIWLSVWPRHLTNLHILKTWISLEQKEIFENSEQRFSSPAGYLFMFWNGFDRKDSLGLIKPILLKLLRLFYLPWCAKEDFNDWQFRWDSHLTCITHNSILKTTTITKKENMTRNRCLETFFYLFQFSYFLFCPSSSSQIPDSCKARRAGYKHQQSSRHSEDRCFERTGFLVKYAVVVLWWIALFQVFHRWSQILILEYTKPISKLPKAEKM